MSGRQAIDGAAVVAEPCQPAALIEQGTHTIEARALDLPIRVDRVVLRDSAPGADTAPTAPTATVVDDGRFRRTIEIDGCDSGCWLVLGEGFNEAWTATGPDGSLGEPQLVDGGFNGWRIAPTSHPVEIVVKWTQQRNLDIAFALSAVGVILALVLFAFLAAVYLTLEADEDDLREDFRRRALGAGVAAFGAAVLVLALAYWSAPLVWTELVGARWWNYSVRAERHFPRRDLAKLALVGGGLVGAGLLYLAFDDDDLDDVEIAEALTLQRREGWDVGGGSAALNLVETSPVDFAGSTTWASELGSLATSLELAGDNAGYRRDRLVAVEESWRDGFWEPEVHAALAARGDRLRHEPSVVVEMGRSAGAAAFLRQRLAHGREFGRARGGRSGAATNMARIGLSLVVPVILAARTFREASRRGRRRALLPVLPLVLLFDTAWAAGEALGHVDALRAR